MYSVFFSHGGLRDTRFITFFYYTFFIHLVRVIRFFTHRSLWFWSYHRPCLRNNLIHCRLLKRFWFSVVGCLSSWSTIRLSKPYNIFLKVLGFIFTLLNLRRISKFYGTWLTCWVGCCRPSVTLLCKFHDFLLLTILTFGSL